MSNLPEPKGPSPGPVPGFFTRLSIGFGLGILGCLASAISMSGPGHQTWAGFVPLVIAGAFAVYLGLSQRRFGYVTGVILAPFAIVAGLYLLLLVICGSGHL